MSDGSASPAPTATPVSTPPATPPCTPPPTRPASPGAAAVAAAAHSASPSAARRKGEAEEREGAATPDDTASAAATSASSRSSCSSSGVLPPVGAAGAGAAAAAALATAPQLVRSAVAASAAGDAAPGGPAAAAATASVGVQASAPPPYRLRVLPARGGGCVRVAARAALSQAGLAALLMVWALLGAWAFRATEGPHERQRASGVRLEQQKLADELAEAARRLAEDGGACGDDTAWRDAAQTAWRAAARQYVVRHEQMLLDAVDDGFGEGGGGYIWTFSGCLLFAVSLLTTLGFGAPVPRTTGGRAAAAVFAAVGIPLHLLLALNAGALFAAHLTRLALRLEARRRRLAPATASASPAPGGRCCASPRWPCGDACWLPAPWAVACAPAAWPCSRRRGECAPAPGPVPARAPLPAVAPTDAGDKFPPIALDAQSALEAGEAKAAAGAGAWAAEEAAAATAAEAPGPPAWLRWLPVSAAFLYYLVGLVAFGAARGRPFAACLLFPLDFTATGGVGRVAGALRAVYALYLEGAVLLAFTGVALHRADAARGLTALGLRWRLIVADHV